MNFEINIQNISIHSKKIFIAFVIKRNSSEGNDVLLERL